MTRFRQGRRSVILATTIVAVLTLLVPTASPVAAVPPGIGHDISWPQCGRPFPQGSAFGIVGVNNGKPYTINPCFTAQARWAAATGLPAAFYINTANPGVRSTSVNWYAQRSPNPACSRANEAACAYNYGYNGARHAFAYAQSQTGAAGRHSWWLDVETTNSWSGNVGLNTATILGSITFLRSQGVPVGAYSTRYQWGRITGGAVLPELPSWVAGARNRSHAATMCAPQYSFTGGPVAMVQWVEHNLDHDHLCSPLPTASAPPPPAPTLEPLIQQLSGDLDALLKKLLGQP